MKDAQQGRQLLKRILSCVLAVVLLACALFALGLMPSARTVHREAWRDVAGNVWTGDYLAGEKRYVGTMRVELAGGAVYEGGFAKGHFNGQGRYTSSTGTVYEGEFVDGVLVNTPKASAP